MGLKWHAGFAILFGWQAQAMAVGCLEPAGVGLIPSLAVSIAGPTDPSSECCAWPAIPIMAPLIPRDGL